MTPGLRRRYRRVLPIGLAVVLILVFCSLGNWQLQRRAWKLDLIRHVEQQLQQPPAPAPGPAAWASVAGPQAYLPLTVSGTFLHDRETLVQAMTRYGSGYWLLTPLRTDRGFVVLINRGFVDPAHRDPAARREAQQAGAVEITGLLRLTEPGGRLLQDNDVAEDRWYSRDVAAIGAARGLKPAELAPYFLDADDDPNPGGWPVGGLTVVQFRNAHLGYALTWYALALMIAVGAWRVLREQSDPPIAGRED